MKNNSFFLGETCNSFFFYTKEYAILKRVSNSYDISIFMSVLHMFFFNILVVYLIYLWFDILILCMYVL